MAKDPRFDELDDRLRRVEQLLDDITRRLGTTGQPASGPGESPAFPVLADYHAAHPVDDRDTASAEVFRLKEAGQMLHAIAQLRREQPGLSLQEAKNLVERL